MPARLILSQPGAQDQTLELSNATVSLGRAAINDVILQDARVSRSHARIECEAGRYVIVDLDSANGTRVNGLPVQRATLAPGDLVTIGSNTLRYQEMASERSFDATIIESDADLELTLAGATIEMTLNDTSVPRLAITAPDRTWELPLVGDLFTIGRGSGNDVVLDHPKVSRSHARIERRGDSFVLRDLESTNGSWRNGDRVTELLLREGDTVRIGESRLIFKAGFAPEELTIAADARPRGLLEGHRPVVFVPGFMGSQLWLGEERLWPNVRHLFRNPDLFDISTNSPIEARGIVDEVVIVPNLIKSEQYNRLGDFLVEALRYERGKDLLEFAYDWRRDVREAARGLAAAIDGWDVPSPIVIIAHSMGCLVSRYYLERLGGKSKVGRAIFLGGPHSGTPTALTSLLVGPNVLPFGLFGEKLRKIIASFPSLYQILPTYGCALDQGGTPIPVLDDDTWLPEAARPLLHNARDFRQELGTASSVPTISIFGYGLKTVTDLSVHRTPDGAWERVDYRTGPGGDDTIPERSAILGGSEIHPVQQHHGAIYVDNDVKMRLKLELARAWASD